MAPHDIIISQYRAGLAMLRQAIDACPQELWNDGAARNPYWRVAYHALFYTHLYLSRSEEEFEPWEKMRPHYQFMGPLPWPPHETLEIGEAYSRPDILAYHALVADAVAPGVAAAPMDGPSGFDWLPMNRLELHLYNIRHTAHHTGQLADRLRRHADTGVDWVGRSHE